MILSQSLRIKWPSSRHLARQMSYVARRVVVTGLGSMTCLGADVASNWSGLLVGKSGIRDVRERLPEGQEADAEVYSGLSSRVAGRIDPEEYARKREVVIPSKADQRTMARINVVSLIVTQEALQVSTLLSYNWKKVIHLGRFIRA